MSITVDHKLIGSSLRSPWRIERSSVKTAESIRGSVELSGSSGASGVVGGDSQSRTHRGRLTGSRGIGRDEGARGWITCDPRGTWPELVSRGISGEAAGRLVEEKVGVTAGIVTENMAADDMIKIYERENRSDEEVRPPRTRGKRIRATTVDFDSLEIASSREASEEPADISAARTRTHWAHSLDQKERTRINGLVLLARAAVAFRAKHGKFLRKLQRGFFNLVHWLARIEGKLTAYPADFSARDFGKIDSLIKCFRVIHGELQPFVGAPVMVKTRQSKSRTPPVSSVGSAPTPTSSFTPGTLLLLNIPLAPPTSTPVIMPRPTTTVPRLTPDVTADPGWEQLLRETFAPKAKAPVVTPVLSPMEATPSSQLSPPATAAPLEDPVSMLDQPELTPEWEAYLKQSTPPDIGIN